MSSASCLWERGRFSASESERQCLKFESQRKKEGSHLPAGTLQFSFLKLFFLTLIFFHSPRQCTINQLHRPVECEIIELNAAEEEEEEAEAESQRGREQLASQAQPAPNSSSSPCSSSQPPPPPRPPSTFARWRSGAAAYVSAARRTRDAAFALSHLAHVVATDAAEFVTGEKSTSGGGSGSRRATAAEAAAVASGGGIRAP